MEALAGAADAHVAQKHAAKKSVHRALDPVIVVNSNEVVQMMRKGERSIKCVNAGLSNVDAVQIAEVLRPTEGECAVEELHLGANKIGNDGANIFGEVLKMKTKLRVLDLAANKIDAKGVEKLADALKVETTPLQTLNLSYNSLGDDGVVRLADALKQNLDSPIAELNLSMNEIEERGCQSIAEVLRGKNGVIRTLNLGRNRCKAGGGRAIAEALKENNTIKRLDLSGSLQCPNIESGGAKAIAEALRMPLPLRELMGDQHEDLFCLTHLFLAFNCIDDDAGKTLAKEMETNKTVKTLGLRGNMLGVESGKAFSEMLCSNDTLQTLDVSDNRLNNAAATSFARALSVNRGLHNLNMSANKLGGQHAADEKKRLRVGQEFAEVVQHNKQMQRIALGGCGLEDEECRIIQESVVKHGVYLKFDLD